MADLRNSVSRHLSGPEKMRAVLFAVATCVLLSPTPPAKADNIPDQPQSSDARMLASVDQHETDVRSLDRRFIDAKRDLENDYAKQRARLRDQLIESLNQELASATKKGELDQAIAVREQIRSTEASSNAPPTSTESSVATYGPATSQGITGRWRWSNGVDITNLPGGRTSGEGTWRVIGSHTKTYEFHWKKIPADRVQLSKNGRVLEGTKLHDPSFRVWAVRID